MDWNSWCMFGTILDSSLGTGQQAEDIEAGGWQRLSVCVCGGGGGGREVTTVINKFNMLSL